MDDISKLSLQISKMTKVFAQYLEQDIEKCERVNNIESEFITVSHRSGKWEDKVKARFDQMLGDIEDDRWRDELFDYYSQITLSEIDSDYMGYAVNLAKCLEGLANHRFDKTSAMALNDRVHSINDWFAFSQVINIHKKNDNAITWYLVWENEEIVDSEKQYKPLYNWFEKNVLAYYHLFVFPPTIGFYFVRDVDKSQIEEDSFSVKYHLESLGVCYANQPSYYIAEQGSWLAVKKVWVVDGEMKVYARRALYDDKWKVTKDYIGKILKVGDKSYSFWEVLRVLRNVNSHGYVKLKSAERDMYERILEGQWESASFMAYGNQILSDCFRYERMGNS